MVFTFGFLTISVMAWHCTQLIFNSKLVVVVVVVFFMGV